MAAHVWETWALFNHVGHTMAVHVWETWALVRDKMLQLRAELVSGLTGPGAHLGVGDGSSPVGALLFSAMVGVLLIFLLPLYAIMRRRSSPAVHSSASSNTSFSSFSPSSLSHTLSSPSPGDGKEFRRLESLPGPPKPWYRMTGHIMELLFGERAQPFVLMDWASRYGRIYKIYQGRFPMVVTTSLPTIQDVLISRFTHFHDHLRSALRSEIVVKGLFFARGKYWTEHRALVMRYFSSQRLKTFVPIMQRATSVLLKKLSDAEQSEVNLGRWLHSLTLDVIGETAFGIPFDTQEECVNKQTILLEAFMSDMKYITQPDSCAVLTLFTRSMRLIFSVDKFLSWIPGTLEHKRARNMQVIFEECKKLVAFRRKEAGRESDTVLQKNVDQNEDLLSYMIRTGCRGKEHRPLTDDELMALTREMLLAGTDTTAETTCLVIALVEKHPRVKLKLLAEIDGWFERHDPAAGASSAVANMSASATDQSLNGGRELGHSIAEANAGGENIPPTMLLMHADILSKFPYLEQVIHETMRLYPIAGFLARESTHDTALEGHVIPEGTPILCNIYGIHRDPEIYPDPEAFRPERFGTSREPLVSAETLSSTAPESEDCCRGSKMDPKTAFFGFGMGPRRCPGQGLAMLEMKVVLINLLRHFELTVVGKDLNDPSDPKVDIVTDFMVRLKGGLHVTVRRRHV